MPYCFIIWVELGFINTTASSIICTTGSTRCFSPILSV